MVKENKMTMEQLERVKQEFPSYFKSLMDKCQTCGNCFSSYECDICENNDMYVKAG